MFERRRSWSDCWPQLPDIGHVATPAMLNLAAGGVPAVKFDQVRFSVPICAWPIGGSAEAALCGGDRLELIDQGWGGAVVGGRGAVVGGRGAGGGRR